ncbi:ubiquitin-conjugating enzyme/RWD-like protein [Apodospora peruviana]|uniref:E2 ubiquitin-conjugating enzyme n=1 Tax=Apodospora peruviana TaxID=516989 RepID=A0AAE0I628_9PEZI|nr:ubiquitin-conjugating enzyme/RWD-like protein [Apodospora peruviana]
MASQKRIAKELSECMANPPAGMRVSLANDADVHKWHIVLEGPPNTPYVGGTFGLVIVLPPEYPFKAPVVTFATRIYHPNVTNDTPGKICLGLLKTENWKPSFKIQTVLQAVRGLLVEPQPDDPLEARIADEFRSDRKEFEKNARQYVTQYAKGPVKFDKKLTSTAGDAAATPGASSS